MESPRELWRRLFNARRSIDLESGLDEEIRFHIERQTEKNLRLGMTPEAARRAALVRFGGVERARETTRDEFRPVVVDDLSRDLRYGVRTLLRSPGFAFVAIVTLGLGIGAATAVFSVVEGVLLQPLPYPEADRIVRLWQIDSNGILMNASEPNFLDWQAQSRSYQSMAVLLPNRSVTVVGGSEPTRAVLSRISREYFDVMRVRPAHGRAFVADEQREGAQPVALISDSYWKRGLGGRPDFAGQTLRFENRIYQIVGVMPPGFDYPYGTEIWTPREQEPPRTSRTAHNFQVLARLADGISRERAERELSSISRALKVRYGDETWMSDATVVRLQDQITSGWKSALYIMLGAAGVLLLIASANVSNLLLARAATRQRELAVRLALGAGRWRITRQLMAESLVLCVAGSALGIAIALGGVKALLTFEPGNLPRVNELGVNWIALALALGLSVTIAIVLGLATTWRVGQRDPRAYLSEAQRTAAGTRGTQRIRDALVVTQVALTLVLLSGAGLLGRSFLQVLAVDPGYRTRDVLLLDLGLDEPINSEMASRQVGFQDELLQRLRALPGVSNAAITNSFPLGWSPYGSGLFIEMSRPDEIQSFEQFKQLMVVKARTGTAGFRLVSPDYFSTMAIPLIRGRVFEANEGVEAPHVAVISESLARTQWPNQDPIGKFIQFGNFDGDLRGFRIVGIVGDVHEISPEKPPEPLFYGNTRQRPGAAHAFTVVLHGPQVGSAAVEAQHIIRQLQPELPVRARRIEDAIDLMLAGRRFSLLLLGVFGVVALMLATMGIYGLISYLVAERTKEIGIRMALGALPGNLFQMIIGRSALLASVGTVVGLGAALGLTRLLGSQLYGVTPTDPIAFGSVVGLIGCAVLVASYLPARRAMRVAPLITLRSE